MEEQIKELMGEAYHEGITTDEIQEFFKKNVLSTGAYVNKEMADAEKRKIQEELNKTKEALGAKLTDDEKKAAEDAAKDARVKELEDLLAKNTMSNNSYKAFGITAEARLNSGIKDDDKEFEEFINNVISEDEEKTKKISNYINKIVKAAYEKGKADMTKNKMAGMGNFNKNENNNDDDKGGIGSRLAKLNTNVDNKKNPYFQI